VVPSFRAHHGNAPRGGQLWPWFRVDRSKDFFAKLGFEFYGVADDMASVIISEHTRVMLLEERPPPPRCCGYWHPPIP
jgi:hypothetical protein